MSAFTRDQFTSECRRLGIYPDGRVNCARTGQTGTVWPYEWWTRIYPAGFIIGVADDQQSNIWAYWDGNWATLSEYELLKP